MKIQPFRKLDAEEAVGGGFRGNVSTTYSDLVRTFGQPHRRYSGDGKVQAEWRFFVEVGDDSSMVVTIYDYKENPGTVEKVTDWHVGGRGPATNHVEWVLRMLEINK